MKKNIAAFIAKSFYNAYINLENFNNIKGNFSFYFPMAVNGVFAIELALKAILINQNIPYKKEHNLAILFDLLPLKIKKMIFLWISEKSSTYTDIDKCFTELILLSNAFTQLRYPFDEDIPSFDTSFLSLFANATIGVMFQLGYNIEYVQVENFISINELDDLIDKNRLDILTKNAEYISKKLKSNKQNPNLPNK